IHIYAIPDLTLPIRYFYRVPAWFIHINRGYVCTGRPFIAVTIFDAEVYEVPFAKYPVRSQIDIRKWTKINLLLNHSHHSVVKISSDFYIECTGVGKGMTGAASECLIIFSTCRVVEVPNAGIIRSKRCCLKFDRITNAQCPGAYSWGLNEIPLNKNGQIQDRFLSFKVDVALNIVTVIAPS